MTKEELIQAFEDKIKEYQQDIVELSEDKKLETLADVRARVKSKPQAIKYKTGHRVIDYKMGGFSEGSFINVAGVNFSGKTTLVLDIIQNISNHNRAVFFSFEMYENLLISNKLVDSSIDNNLVIVQDKYDLLQIEAIIRNEAEKGVKFFAIDSKMKIKANVKQQDYQKVSTISSTLARLTQELGIIILLINQMALTDIREKRLEFKGSGDVSYDSDVSLFITVDDDENRTLHCKKDRINERTWTEDITDRKFKDQQPVVVEYRTEVDMPLL